MAIPNNNRLVRVNTRLSEDLNNWVDEYSLNTGLSKSVIIMMATEKFREHALALKGMNDVSLILRKLEELEIKLTKY